MWTRRPVLINKAIVDLSNTVHMLRAIIINFMPNILRTMHHQTKTQIGTDSKREHCDYLDERSKTVFDSANPSFRSPLESVRRMLSSQACRGASHAEVVDCALSAMPNSLESFVGQNVKSPFSNIHAITFKLCSRLRRISAANRPSSKSPPVPKST